MRKSHRIGSRSWLSWSPRHKFFLTYTGGCRKINVNRLKVIFFSKTKQTTKGQKCEINRYGIRTHTPRIKRPNSKHRGSSCQTAKGIKKLFPNFFFVFQNDPVSTFFHFSSEKISAIWKLNFNRKKQNKNICWCFRCFCCRCCCCYRCCYCCCYRCCRCCRRCGGCCYFCCCCYCCYRCCCWFWSTFSRQDFLIIWIAIFFIINFYLDKHEF